MKEYIEREAVVVFLENMAASRYLIQCFENKEKFPSADVTPIVHGEWIPKEIKYPMFGCLITIAYTCSSCGTTHEHQTNYCPNCGAYMNRGSK